MLVPFLIMMREGIEAALIVGIVAGYLKRSGRGKWMASVWTGVALAALLCLAVGLTLDLLSAEFPEREQEMFEAAVGLIAVIVLTSMVFWMKKAARSIRAHLLDSIDSALRASDRQGFALVGISFFAVAREGFESVFFLLATFHQSSGIAAPIGAVAGLVVAIAFGVALYYGSVALDLQRFFRWTGLFVLFVAAGLLASSLRSLHEAGLWNGLHQIAFDLSALLPRDGALGSVLAGIFGYHDTPSVGEVSAYCIFLIVTLPLFLSNLAPPAAAKSHA